MVSVTQRSRIGSRSTALSALTEVAGAPLVVWLALLSELVRYVGAVWDVSWHRTVGRDTFWSPPHLVLYGGVLLGAGAALWALDASRRRPPEGLAAWRTGGRRWPVAFVLVAAGAAITLLSAPFDDLWHALFGRDVDIWSLPHLTAIFGDVVGLFGWLLALIGLTRARREATTGRARRVPALLFSLFIGLVLYAGWFSLNWYHMVAATRDALLYPALVGLLVLPPLVVARRLSQERWAATTGTLAFMLLASVPVVVLAAFGWREPSWPPLLVVPALGLDVLHALTRRRLALVPLALLAGLAFAALFVAVELARVQLYPPAIPSWAFGAPVVGPYYVAAATRPWTLASLAGALPVIFGAHVLGSLAGHLLARLLAGSGSREPLAVVPPVAGARNAGPRVLV